MAHEFSDRQATSDDLSTKLVTLQDERDRAVEALRRLVTKVEDLQRELDSARNSDQYRRRPPVLRGRTVQTNVGCGPLYVTLNEDEAGRPFELFFKLGKSGSCQQSYLEALGVAMSVGLRYGADPQKFIDKFAGMRCPNPTARNGDGPGTLSCADGISQGLAKALEVVFSETRAATEHLTDVPEPQGPDVFLPTVVAAAKQNGFGAGLCPRCNGNLAIDGGFEQLRLVWLHRKGSLMEIHSRAIWSLHPGFLNQKPLEVAVVGVGGTGSELVSNLIHLHLGLAALGYGGLHVVAFDADSVTHANVVRQRYVSADIGRNKAEVLIGRCNLASSLDWSAVPSRFTGAYARRAWNLVISCVDTRKSRQQLHKLAFEDRLTGGWYFWLDTGNSTASGQVVLGTPRSKRHATLHMLPCATELHPELMDVSIPDDEGPSCSALEALQRQDLMVNKMVAVLAVDMLWRLFRDKQISAHARYFDLARSSVAERAVPAKSPRRGTQRTTKNEEQQTEVTHRRQQSAVLIPPGDA